MNKNTLVKKLNKEIAPFVSGKYFETMGESFNGIVNVLNANNIDLGPESLTLFNAGNSGSKNWEFVSPVGKGKIYLSISWYKMESGRWEIVAYFS